MEDSKYWQTNGIFYLAGALAPSNFNISMWNCDIEILAQFDLTVHTEIVLQSSELVWNSDIVILVSLAAWSYDGIWPAAIHQYPYDTF